MTRCRGPAFQVHAQGVAIAVNDARCRRLGNHVASTGKREKVLHNDGGWLVVVIRPIGKDVWGIWIASKA